MNTRLGFSLVVFLSVSAASAATINIGVFNSSQSVAVGPGAFANPFNQADSTLNNAPLGLGAQREFIARRSAGTGRIQLDIDATAIDALSFSSSGDAVGRGLVTWDGPSIGVSSFDPQSGDAAIQRGQPDTFGLTGSGATGGVDLTDGGTNNAISIFADADNDGLPVYFHFYRSAGVYATATATITGDAPFVLKRYVIFFSQFTASGATVQDIFTDVKAITMQIDGRNASDATFDDLQAMYVPEPGSWMLVGLGGAVCGLLRLRRR